MIASSYSLSDEPRRASLSVAEIKNFDFGKPLEVPAKEILDNPFISLYCLDFETRQAVFVETPAEIDLSTEPFYFLTQFDNAVRVLTTSFEVMIELAKAVSLTETRLIFILSVGRSGSTLASQIFSKLPGVLTISEPDALTNCVVARHNHLYDEKGLIELVRASVNLLRKSDPSKICVIKGRSFVVDIADWLHRLFPNAKHLFLYRDAASYLESGLRAFGQANEPSEEEKLEKQRQRHLYLGSLVPAIREYNPKRFLSHAGTLSLMWLSAMESYSIFCELGATSLAIKYDNWKTNPSATAKAMLEFCQCLPEDMTLVHQVLSRDSQRGTQLSKESLRRKSKIIREEDLEELHHHLKNYAYINSAYVDVPNTLNMDDY